MSSACLSLASAPLTTTPRELRANVFAHGWGVVVQIFVPGCAASDIHLTVTGEVISVATVVPCLKEGLCLVNERETGESEREFGLTPDLDVARLTRSLTDGVLTIVIPRHGAFSAVESVPCLQ